MYTGSHPELNRMFLAIVFFLVFLLPQFALAHHGGAEYDLSKTVEFKGKLTSVEMINPHSWLYFDVTETDGKVSHHRCEMRSVHVLRRSGWTKELFPVGQQITIEASPNQYRSGLVLSANHRDGGRNPHGPLWPIRQGATGWRPGSPRAQSLRRRSTGRSGAQRASRISRATGRRSSR